MKLKLSYLILFNIFSVNLLFAQSLPHTFSANSAAKAEEVNENFQFLANQFKVNKKTIDCSTDNMTKAIEDGYNHLVLNGTCKGHLLITPVSGFLEKLYQNYGWVSNKPVYSLTLEGGSQGGVWDDTGIGAKTSLLVRGNLVLKNLTIKHQISLQNNSLLIADNVTTEKMNVMSGSSADFVNSTIKCDSSYELDCVYLEDGGVLDMNKVTLTMEGVGSAVSVNKNSTAEIKESNINRTSNGEVLVVQYNSSLQLEDTNVTAASGEAFIGFNGYLNLSGGSIKRTSGTPTVRVLGPSIFHVSSSGTVADIECDGKLVYLDKGSSSATITNNNNAECQ